MDTFFQTLRLNSAPTIYRCEPQWSWRCRMADYDLWCVLKGKGRMILNDKAYQLEPGRTFVLGPDTIGTASHDPANRLHVFAVHFDVLTEDGNPTHLDRHLLPSLGHVTEDLAVLFTMGRCAANAWNSGLPAGRIRSQLLVRQLLLQLCDEAQRPMGKSDSRIDAVAYEIQEEPGRHWTVEQLARENSLSRSQFTRRFTNHLGMSPSRFIIHARISRAETLLQETDMPVGLIADAMGYPDIFYFSRQFKQVTGRTPSIYRQGFRISVTDIGSN